MIFWVPLWSIALVLFVAMVATVEITMWFGGRVRAREGEEKQESSTVPSAVLGPVSYTHLTLPTILRV